jgi:BMFP domain-containing protein YqiC
LKGWKEWALLAVMIIGLALFILLVSLLTEAPAESRITLEQRVNALERNMLAYHENLRPEDGAQEGLVKFRRKLNELEARIEALEDER